MASGNEGNSRRPMSQVFLNLLVKEITEEVVQSLKKDTIEEIQTQLQTDITNIRERIITHMTHLGDLEPHTEHIRLLIRQEITQEFQQYKAELQRTLDKEREAFLTPVIEIYGIMPTIDRTTPGLGIRAPYRIEIHPSRYEKVRMGVKFFFPKELIMIIETLDTLSSRKIFVRNHVWTSNTELIFTIENQSTTTVFIAEGDLILKIHFTYSLAVTPFHASKSVSRQPYLAGYGQSSSNTSSTR